MAFNRLDAAQAERLALLLEKLGAATQVVGKVLRHGYVANDPEDEDQLLPMREWLEQELGEVLAVGTMLTQAGDLDIERIKAARRVRLEEHDPFLHHQA